MILKILKYCTGSSARSYQCKFAVSDVFGNKRIDSMEEVGAAIKEIIHNRALRDKFSSVHPDLAAEGITKVEVREEGLHFFKDRETGEIVQQARVFFCTSKSLDEEVADEMLLHQLRSEDKEENGRVNVVVAIDKELLKMIKASAHPDLASEGTTKNNPG